MAFDDEMNEIIRLAGLIVEDIGKGKTEAIPRLAGSILYNANQVKKAK